MDDERNFYEILGVDAYATPQQIQTAFQKKIDGVNRSERFNDLDTYATILKAYQVLSDDEKRKDYDHYLKVSFELGIVQEAPMYLTHSEKKRATLRVTPAELGFGLWRAPETREMIRQIERDAAVARAQRLDADPGHLTCRHQRVEHGGLEVLDARGQHFALQDRGRDRRALQLFDGIEQRLEPTPS